MPCFFKAVGKEFCCIQHLSFFAEIAAASGLYFSSTCQPPSSSHFCVVPRPFNWAHVFKRLEKEVLEIFSPLRFPWDLGFLSVHRTCCCSAYPSTPRIELLDIFTAPKKVKNTSLFNALLTFCNDVVGRNSFFPRDLKDYSVFGRISD